MDSLLTIAASGLKARMESLDIIANNLANVSTTGFKVDREAFSVYSSQDAENPADGRVALSPITERHTTDLAQGSLTPTGNPLDLAIEGAGFLTVSTGGRLAYTRNGQIKFGSGGALETAEGYRLQSVVGTPLIVNPLLPVDVDRLGSIYQDGQLIGQVLVSAIDDPGRLEKLGSTYFGVAGDGSLPRSDAQIRQGYLEASNVNSSDSSIRLVGVMRQFEMLQRAMQLGAEMNKRSIDEVAKVN